MSDPKHCPEHEQLVINTAVIADGIKGIRLGIDGINARLDKMNGRITKNEIANATLRAWAVGAGAGAGAVMGLAIAIIFKLLK